MTDDARVTFSVVERAASFRPYAGGFANIVKVPLDLSLPWVLKVRGVAKLKRVTMYYEETKDTFAGLYECDKSVWPKVGAVQLFGFNS